MNNLKQLLKQSPLYPLYRKADHHLQYLVWIFSSKTGAPPHKVKEQAVIEFGREHNLPVLVETGTYLGDMIVATAPHFKKIYSIEIDKILYEKASVKFADSPHIEILLGDSGVVIKNLLPKLSDGVLFWLDGHFSGGVTGRGVLDSPIAQELEAIFSSPLQQVAILIDDARLFVGTDGYPTINELRNFVEMHKSGWSFELENDIIRIFLKK